MTGNWKELFSGGILVRGEEYFNSGKAKKLQEEEDGFSATVRGSRNYRVHIRTSWEDGEEFIEDMSCTCPYVQGGAKYCKHMAAVLFLIEEERYPLLIRKASPGKKTPSRRKVSADGASGKNADSDASSGGSASGKGSAAGKRAASGAASGSGASGKGSAAGKSAASGKAASAGDRSGRHGAGAGGKGKPVRKEDRSSALPENPMARGLAALLQEERRQMEEQQAEETDGGSGSETRGSTSGGGAAGTSAGRPRHMEPYRYFHYEKYEDGVKISADVRKKARKLLDSGELGRMNVELGYPSRRLDGGSTQGLIGIASVRFDSGYSQTRLVFDADHIVEENCTYWTCRGGYYSRRIGEPITLCEHSAALLQMLREYLERENPGDATSYSGMEMLDQSGQGTFLLSDTKEFEAPALEIRPVIDIPQYSDKNECIPSVFFRAGTSRMYKVKKIGEFVDAMKAGEEMKFGTKAMIRLGEELLTKDSMVWYRFMQDALREERQRNLALDPYASRGFTGYSTGYAVGAQIQDAIPLYGAALDSFYKEAEGKRLEFSIREEGTGRRAESKRKAELLFCERQLDLQVEISPFFAEFTPVSPDASGPGTRGGRRLKKAAADTGRTSSGSTPEENAASQGILQGIRISGEAPHLIGGREASYFVDEKNGEFCRVDRAQVEKIAPILGAARDGIIDATIGRRNLRDFYQRALPQLREAVNVVEYDSDLIASYLPPDPVFVYYFDIEGSAVMCRPDVHYGMQIHTLMDNLDQMPWTKPRLESYRDIPREQQALELVMKYIPQVFVELCVLAMNREEEERLFNLLAYGLEELMGVGEVRMTEAFRRLGLRRHMKFSLGVSVESNLMDLQIQSEDLTEEELLSVFYQYQKKRKFVRLKNGDFLQLDKNETIERLLEIMETMGVSLQEFVRGKMQVPAYRALYLDKMLEQMQDVYTDRDRHFKALIKEFKTVEDADFELPASLRGILRKYQVAGYRWLRTLDQYGFGGILADEMGLGKTLQVIAVLLSEKEAREQEARESDSQPAQPALPYSGQNPPAEANTTSADTLSEESETADALPAAAGAADALSVPAGTAGAAPAEPGKAAAPSAESGPAASTTSLVVCPASLVYNWGEELRRFAPQLRTGLVTGTKRERAVIIENYSAFDVLVTSYDLLKRDIAAYEGKNFRFEIIDEAQYIKNHLTSAAKSVKLIRAKTRFALTGTPIENRLSELWSIFDFLMPGFLYTYSHFSADLEQPIVKFQNEAAMERLRRMASPFILRRRKEDVLRDLPEKLEEVRYAGMETRQRRLYDGQVVRMKTDMKGQSEADFRKSRIQILAELTKIRQICCDPSLILENYDGGSAKRETCMELIRNVIEGEHKALVFSQFAAMLELLEADLKKENIDYFKITGATPKERRIEMVKAFNGDKTPVFLISLKAGGTGLNLTGADVVIHYDPWWNIAAQNQATDRAHRIGQTRIVTVYRLIVKDTIEERILEMQENKKKLAEDILSAEAVSSSAISREDLLELLG